MTTAIVSPKQKERLAAYKAMTEDLQELAEHCEELLERGARGCVLVDYCLGVKVNTVRGDIPTNDRARYGTEAIKQLSVYLEIDPATLYDLGNFARAFTREMVEEWMKKKSPAGCFQLEVSHWVRLASIHSAKHRMAMLQKTFNLGLSVRALGEAIQSDGIPLRRPRQGGKKKLLPTSPLGGLQTMCDMADRLIQFESAMVKAVFKPLQQVSPDNIDKHVLQNLLETRERIQKIIQSCESLLTEANETVERVTRVMEKKSPESGKPAASELPEPKKTKRKEEPAVT